VITGFNRGIGHLDRALHALDCARRDAMDHMNDAEFRRFTDTLGFGSEELTKAFKELPDEPTLADARTAVSNLRNVMSEDPFGDDEELVTSDGFTNALNGAHRALDGLKRIEQDQKANRDEQLAMLARNAKNRGRIGGRLIDRREATSMLRIYLNKDLKDITDNEAKLMYAVASLSSRRRPLLPEDVLADIRRNVEWNRVPGDAADTAREFARARRALARQDIIDDPLVTREALTQEFDKLVLTTKLRADPEVTQRLALLESLPARLRPPMPKFESGFTLEEYARQGEWLNEDVVARNLYKLREAARSRANIDPASIRDLVQEAMRTGDRLPRGAYRAIIKAKLVNDPALGADPRTLLSNGLRGLIRYKERNPEVLMAVDVPVEMEEFAKALKAGDETDRKLIAMARKALKQTVERANLARKDGYKGEADFAQLGHAASALDYAALRLADSTPA
jgi:hypothetical protein